MIVHHLLMLFITGGMGFIGPHVAREFAQQGEDVAVSQFRTKRDPALLEELFGSNVKVVPLDMTDGAAVLRAFEDTGATSAMHLLAPPIGALEPGEDYRTNMSALGNLLTAAHKVGMTRVTCASSIAVYHGLSKGPYREDDLLPIKSTNPTEAFKKSEEILALHFADRTGLDVVFGRLGGIYGPLYHSVINLPSRLCHAAVKGRDPKLMRDGVPFRQAEDEDDSCYVKDVAYGLRLLHTTGNLKHRIYNIGGGRPVKSHEIAAAVQKAVPGYKVELPPGKRPGAGTDHVLDITRAREDLGYEPRFSIEAGVADYVSWLRAHPE
jgi:UDP-glucose 4-epimerase